ncbi:siderophore-interacting protein [Pelomonas sp. HMWF004]|nr:siderophore-interacting protein [Pelomonas sp. HMWF004]
MSRNVTPLDGRRASDSWGAQWLTRLFFHEAEVQANEALAPGLHRITLQGPQLRRLLWSPGDKLQLKLGRGMVTRTYTPMQWDTEAGRTDFIAHTLATGPGSDWVRDAAPGVPVAVFGPRSSLALNELDPADSLLVGDETSLSLAAAWRPARVLLEAGVPTAVQQVADVLGLRAWVVARLPGHMHWSELAAMMRTAVGPSTRVVLTGRAATVQHLLRQLKAHGIAASRIHTKAYWADGKAGLD